MRLQIKRVLRESLVLIFVSLLFCSDTHAAIIVRPWVPIFKGVEYAACEADAAEPRLQKVYAMRIDLTDTNIAFYSTPSNGAGALETDSQRVGDFLLSSGVKVALNANFFSPCCNSFSEPKDLLGLAMSEGTQVSPQTTSGTGVAVMTVTRSNQVAFVNTSPTISTSNIWTAVAGSYFLIQNGNNLFAGSSDTTLNPHTVVGVSADNRYLIMLAIDGRAAGYSEGTTDKESAEWLLRLGAHTGINLDGGGSTTMVKEQNGGALLLNRPQGGTFTRFNGNNFGAFTVPVAPSIVTQSLSQAIIGGQDATFNVLAGGTTPMTFQWRFNGADIAGATTNSLTINNAQATDAGNYTLFASNSVGTVTSTNITLTVNYTLAVNAGFGGLVSKNPNQSVHAPDSVVILTATPDPGFTFAGWSGDASGSINPLNVTLDTNKIITANFSGAPLEIIIDNPQASFTGTWATGTTQSGKFGSDYRTTPSSATPESALFRPTIFTPGLYAIYVWHPIDLTATTNSQWLISHEGGSATASVNQSINGGGWHLLTGPRSFSRGTNGYVQVSDNTLELLKTVYADAVRLVWGDIPAITNPPASQTVAIGSTVIFSAGVSGSAPLSYQWRFNGGNISGATLSSYTKNNAQLSDSGNYSLFVTNLYGTATSSDAILDVQNPPSIIAHPDNQSVPQAINVTFNVSAAGSPTLTYQWKFDAVDIPGATDSSYTRNNIQSTDAGNYSVAVMNTVGNVLSSNAVLIVSSTPAPPTITSQPQTRNKNAGNTANFTVSANGTSPLNFQWKKNNENLTDGGNISGATTPALKITSVAQSNAANYSVEISNVAGSVTSAEAELIVNDGIPEIVLVESRNGGGTAGGITPNPPYFESAPSWSGSASHSTAPGTTAGIGSRFGSSGTPAFQVTPTLNTAGGTYAVEATHISGNASPNIIVGVSSTGGSGLPATTTVFQSTQGINVWASIGTLILDPGVTNPTVTFTYASGTLASTGGRFYADGIRFVNVGAIAPAITSHPVSRTNGSGTTASFSALASGTGPLRYQWKKDGIALSNGGNVSGAESTTLILQNVSVGDAASYTMTVTNDFGSATTSSANLGIIEPPTIVSHPESRTNNAGTMVTFAVIADGAEPLSYQWKKDSTALIDSGNISGALSSTLTLASVLAADAADYTVSVTSSEGVSALSSNATLVVIDPVITAQPFSQSNNAGTTATFTVNAVGTAPFSYQWRRDGVELSNSENISGATDATLVLSNISQSDAAIYSVIVSNRAGSSASFDAALTVIDLPIIVEQPANLKVSFGSEATFRVTASGVDLHYQWRFNDVEIIGATESSFTLNAAQNEDSGDYSVIVSNFVGFVTSSNAALSIIAKDGDLPSIAITNPKTSGKTNAAVIQISGTAKDISSAVVGVKYLLLPSAHFINAPISSNGTRTDWVTSDVTLTPGTNFVVAYSIDASGNQSILRTNKFFYDSISSLTVKVSGDGEVKTNTSGFVTHNQQIPLLVGRPFSLTASIGKGTNYVFTNWTDGASAQVSSTPTYAFLMQSNLTLQANFITNPFTIVSGRYNGLFSEANITHESAGFFTVNLSEKAAYSGAVYLDGDRFSISGKFNLSGQTSRTISRAAKGKANLNLFLELDWSNASQQIHGTLSNTIWNAALLGHRATFSLTNPGTNFVGASTFLVPATNHPVNAPGGIGYGLVTNNLLGIVSLSGALGDGAKIAQKVSISKDGLWPLFAQLYKSTNAITNLLTGLPATNKADYRGSLLGWVTFTNQKPVGNLVWIKTTNAAINYFYPAGFTSALDLIGSPYVAPASGIRSLNITNDTITFADGNLDAAIQWDFTWLTNNTITAVGPTPKPVFSLTRKTGLFKGTFPHPQLGRPTNFFGAVLQNLNYAGGYFLGTNQTGSFELDGN